jgi:hypothetical protein
MSHFSVTVCLPADTVLDKVEDTLNDVLAQWDENRECPLRRDYEDGGPEDYWWVRSVRRGGHADDAELARRLGEHPTWADVVAAYNAKYHPENVVAVPGEEKELDTERLHYDDETGRAYTWTTRNPDAMWDYWRIGGRWSGHFVAREVTSEVLLPDSHWDGPKGLGRGLVDGGPKRLLDFDAMRQRAADEAHVRYDEWDALCAKTPSAKEWAHFLGLHKAGELTIEQARERYGAQPRIMAARADEEMGWYDDIIEHFGVSREEYVANARRDAVPGYALITLDRQWMAPGRMGWFGMSSDEPGTVDAYKTEANAYLEALGDDVLIVQIDCHI